MVVAPATPNEFGEWLRDHPSHVLRTIPFVHGPEADAELSREQWNRVIDFSPADQVITVQAGVPLSELQWVLAERGQCLPLPPDDDLLARIGISSRGSVGELLAFGLPHPWQSRFGPWRDWVLGMQVVTGDGLVARVGAKVVKSVAGFDWHRFVVGTRETFTVLTEVTFRTYPLRALPDWVAPDHRLDSLIARYCPVGEVPSGAVITDADAGLAWFPGSTPDQLPVPEAEQAQLRRLKDVMDPAHRLNPDQILF